MNRIQCPQCGATEAFRRAELLYADSVSHIKGQLRGSSVSAGLGAGVSGALGMGAGVGSLDGTINATQATQLARHVAPPSRPSVVTYADALGALCVLFALGGMVVALGIGMGIAAASTVSGTALAWRIVLALGVVDCAVSIGGAWALFGHARNVKAYRAALEQRWLEEYGDWQRLWFCARCGFREHLLEDGQPWSAPSRPQLAPTPGAATRRFTRGFVVAGLVCGGIALAADLTFQGTNSWRAREAAARLKEAMAREEALLADKKACTSGDGAACFRVAEQSQDPVKAFEYLKLACAGSSGPACAKLGELYDQGTPYVARNWQESTRFKGQACELGEVKACVEAGRSLPNEERGALYHEKACTLGSADGCEALASRYFNGWGRPRDRAKGVVLLDTACTLGSASACSDLQSSYRAGRDVPADPAKARAYGDRAEELRMRRP